MSEIGIYQTESGGVEVRLEQDTIWLSQEQMAALFDVQKAAVSKHLKNIYASGELERPATVSKMETVRQEGVCYVSRQIEHFNLDAEIDHLDDETMLAVNGLWQFASDSLDDQLGSYLTHIA